jgi:rhodanese-related sulfurtransferase
MTATDDPLVTTDWLAALLDDPKVKVVDASYKMPGVTPLPVDDYLAAHIPGAVFFDVNAIADPNDPRPHMFPNAEKFARDAAALGISSGDTVVVYDSGAWVAAPRAWWMFVAFGHRDVKVLDGGLKKWRAEGRAVESGKVTPKLGNFEAHFDSTFVRNKEQLLDNLQTQKEQVIDARPRPRFEGTVVEPWGGGRPPPPPPRQVRLDLHFILSVDLIDTHVHALVLGGGDVLAHVIGPDRQLAVAAINQHRQLYPRRPSVVEYRVDRGTHRAPGIEHVVDDHDRLVVDAEVEVRGVDDRRRGPRCQVVAVERDVDVAERYARFEQLARQRLQAPRQHRPTPVNPDERHRAVRVLLDNLVSDPHQRAAHVIAVEYDRCHLNALLPGLTGPG